MRSGLCCFGIIRLEAHKVNSYMLPSIKVSYDLDTKSKRSLKKSKGPNAHFLFVATADLKWASSDDSDLEAGGKSQKPHFS